MGPPCHVSARISTVQIEEGGLDDPAVIALLGEHLEEMQATPVESVHALGVADLRRADLSLWTGRLDEQVVGVGALEP
jgi:putative acetyltransferase